jgi:Zn-dependent peptidase ImmA (M78 family)
MSVDRGDSARVLARAVLPEYFNGKMVTYSYKSISNAYDYGVPFVFRSFSKYEGVYIPAENDGDCPVVGINIKRPITRQRFTAAHELCHHIMDCNSSSICAFNSSNPIEKYAERFAAELLMPIDELKKQVHYYAHKDAVSYDDVLRFSEYFGVSFQAFLNRIAFVLRRIEGTAETLRKEATRYKPDKKREALGFSYLPLYEQLINAAELNLRLKPSEFTKAKFCTEYIFNDSRLEGVELPIENVAEIVTDIRLNGAMSPFCTEENKDIIEVAGHANMYAYIFDKGLGQKTEYIFHNLLHQMLFSCAPEPDFGGKFRTSNLLLLVPNLRQ